MSDSAQIRFSSPQDTCDFAQAIAPCLAAGDVILLEGGIGAGKTHFSRCLIQTLLDEPEDIPSPTFTLVQTYQSPACEIWHADLYRLSHPDDVVELGLEDAFTQAICLVEWPDRLGELAPKNALTIQLDTTDVDDTRLAKLTWDTPYWGSLLKEILNEN